MCCCQFHCCHLWTVILAKSLVNGIFFKTRLATINQLLLGTSFNCLHTLTGKYTNFFVLNWQFILKIALILAYLLLLCTCRREFMRLADICETADSVFCWLVGWNLTVSTMYICGTIYSLMADCKTDHYYAAIVVRFIAIAAMLLPPAMLNSEVNLQNISNLIEIDYTKPIQFHIHW